ncbi:hypothetical protein Ciccas_012873 [Cichlidogyrus casuarinus]|uniref:Uncharacterized protein n=1 Tax=Cichlidogyrus casuarinus TaxID=1844966 RepID=A0ABD2PPI7_9PLAT
MPQPQLYYPSLSNGYNLVEPGAVAPYLENPYSNPILQQNGVATAAQSACIGQASLVPLVPTDQTMNTHGDSGISSSDTPPISSEETNVDVLEKLRHLDLRVESQHKGRSLILTGKKSQLKQALEALCASEEYSSEDVRHTDNATPIIIEAGNVQLSLLES